MIKHVTLHVCDYCQKDISYLTKREFQDSVYLVRMPNKHIAELCSLGCYVNYCLKYQRSHKNGRI